MVSQISRWDSAKGDEILRALSSPPFARFQVAPHLQRLVAPLRDEPFQLHHSEYSRTTIEEESDCLAIPWGGLAGVTIFAQRGTDAQKELKKLNLERGQVTRLPMYSDRETTVIPF